ncbi:AraC family transcriptional regulator [Bradyrhizobium erythrophlei]|uniref:AraC family transcriptional regulator n=1 Tax=Bradyrhizobium erythrophlei TaxID=1437360 RepID=UPI0035ED8182
MKRIAFSSDDLPAALDDRARFSQWRDIYNDVIRPTDVARFSDRPFSACYEVLPLASAVITQFRGAASSLRGLSARVTDNRGLFLSFDLGGGGRRLSQCGKDIITTGDGAFLASLADLGTVELLPGTGALSVLLPSDQLLSAVPDVEDLVATRLNAGHPSMVYLRRYLQFLMQDDGIGDDPALVKHIDTTLVDLAVLALGAQRDAAEVASGRGLRAARLREVLLAIKNGFDDPAFSSGQVARAHGVTSRYVNDLLYETGKTLAERVLDLRLEKAHAMLSNRGHDHLKIGEIALSCGFNEVSYFNRCFRRRYGLSPTACRGGA